MPMAHLNFKYCSELVLIALSAALFGPPVSSAAAQEVTIAERTLFLDKHFRNTEKQQIGYAFRQRAGEIPAFRDEASVEVLERHPDGTASVTTRFLSNEHAFPVPPLDQAQGNPIILGFLENDIANMKRLTGGSTNYFRKRIRMALAANDVRIRKITVDYKTRTVPALEITVLPYTDNTQKHRLQQYADKAYVFVTSEDVPGTVYCLYTLLNEEKDRAADTSITIAGGAPKQCKSEN